MLTMMSSNFGFSPFLSLCFLLLLISCNPDDSATIPEEITEEEALELMEYSLQASTGGLEQTINLYSEKLLEDITVNYACETLYQDSVLYTYDGIMIQADYLYEWAYELDCNILNIPTGVTFASDAVGSYVTNRIQSSDTTAMNFDVSGLLPSEQYLSYSGNLLSAGNQAFMTNFNNTNSESLLDMTITELTVDKTDYHISGGNGILTLNVIRNDQEYTFEGAMVFNGDSTLIININGTDYLIDLN